MNASLSVVIISHGRDHHLGNVLDGLTHQTLPPGEVVIVFMNQPEHPAMGSELPITTVDVFGSDTLPLAHARNRGAARATGEVLVFLDVDCIPADNFCEQLIADLSLYGGLIMGTPRYLDEGQDVTSDLFSVSRAHPNRGSIPTGKQSNYSLFWSLCFGISKADFGRTGGFDEAFKGYGAEDTDFAWSCERSGVPFALSDATVFHQYHASYSPPLNHFDDVVTNASAFFGKWGMWPMEGWLSAFASAGFVDWTPAATELQVLRKPTSDDIAGALVVGEA